MILQNIFFHPKYLCASVLICGQKNEKYYPNFNFSTNICHQC
jgi:hypothetical protein